MECETYGRLILLYGDDRLVTRYVSDESAEAA